MGFVGRVRNWQALQGIRQRLPEVATAADSGQEGVGGIIFVQVKERLLRDAVQLFQVPLNFSVPGVGKGLH
jgi:hypothetical protein